MGGEDREVVEATVEGLAVDVVVASEEAEAEEADAGKWSHEKKETKRGYTMARIGVYRRWNLEEDSMELVKGT